MAGVGGMGIGRDGNGIDGLGCRYCACGREGVWVFMIKFGYG